MKGMEDVEDMTNIKVIDGVGDPKNIGDTTTGTCFCPWHYPCSVLALIFVPVVSLSTKLKEYMENIHYVRSGVEALYSMFPNVTRKSIHLCT